MNQGLQNGELSLQNTLKNIYQVHDTNAFARPIMSGLHLDTSAIFKEIGLNGLYARYKVIIICLFDILTICSNGMSFTSSDRANAMDC